MLGTCWDYRTEKTWVNVNSTKNILKNVLYLVQKNLTERQHETERDGSVLILSLQDQMQLAKDTQVLAEGQDKLTNLRTPGVAKEELLAEQVRDQKRIALDQELLVQSQKRLAEDMDNAIDGKLRWERLEDYRSLLQKWQNTWGLPGRRVVCTVHASDCFSKCICIRWMTLSFFTATTTPTACDQTLCLFELKIELWEIAVWTLTALKSLNRILAAESSKRETDSGLPSWRSQCSKGRNNNVIVSNTVFLIYIGKFCSARLEFTKGCISCLGSWTSTWWKTLQGCFLMKVHVFFGEGKGSPPRLTKFHEKRRCSPEYPLKAGHFL